jgi:hypothetical protein
MKCELNIRGGRVRKEVREKSGKCGRKKTQETKGKFVKRR